MDTLLIELADSKNVFDLLEALLRRCRRDLAALKASRDVDVLRAGRHDLLKRSRALCNGLSTLLTETHRAAIRSLLQDCELPFVLACRTLAEALDERCGSLMLPLFCGRGDRTIPAGRGVVPAPARQRKLFGDHLSPRPGSQFEDLDAVASLRLLPDALGVFSVEVTFRGSAPLCGLVKGDLVAVGIMNQTYQDDLAAQEVTPTTFFRVRPKDCAAQSVRLLQILEAAEVQAVRVLVLPELCLTEELRCAALEWLAAKKRELRFIVAGSEHVVDSTNQTPRNRAHAFSNDGTAWTHDKFVRFVGSDHREEAIDTTPATIRLRYAGTSTFVILVCKDFLEPKVKDIIASAHVRFVFICALSDKAYVFKGRIADLVLQSQATVVLANTPNTDGSEPRAYFGAPLPTSLVWDQGAKTVPHGGLITFKLGRKAPHLYVFPAQPVDIPLQPAPAGHTLR